MKKDGKSNKECKLEKENTIMKEAFDSKEK